MEKEDEKRDCNAEEDKVTNVDEPETKEKEEELLTSEGGKPTFICAIYRRDILSFLPRTKIEEMRTLSQRWNYDIITTSSDYLPRIVYPSMEVFVGKKRGYRLMYIDGRAIQSRFTAFSRCCKEIKEKAGQELNGQLVFPHRDADDVVVVRLQTSTSSPVFRAPNKLTEETAGTMIHFLSHLNGRCVSRLRVQADLLKLSDESGEPIGVFNPLIRNVYRAALKKPLRLYTKRVELVRLL